jgi:hypothetical protein
MVLKGRIPGATTKPGCKFRKLPILDISRRGIPKRNGIDMELKRLLDVFKQTQFYKGNFIGTTDSIGAFRRDVMGVLLDRIYDCMNPDDSDFVIRLDPSNQESLRKFRLLISRYEDRLKASMPGEGKAIIELNDFPVAVDEGSNIGRFTVTNITREFVVLEWDREGSMAMAAVPFGKEEIHDGYRVMFRGIGNKVAAEENYLS